MNSRSNGRTRTFVGPVDNPDKYELVSVKSRGGEGEVWRGSILVDSVHVPVAIKRILPSNEDDIESWFTRWNRQAELLRSLDHPGLVKVREVFMGPEPHAWHGADPSTSTLYLVMNWVEGPTLSEWVNRHPDRDALETLRIVGAIASAVDFLHSGTSTGQPVLHRDIKPANVIVASDGARLVDFGFVRAAETPDPMTMVGTPDFIAPEAAAGLGFSEASDRFALGATAFYALTGEKPRHEDPAWMRKQLLGVRGLERRPETHDLVLAMMTPQASERPSSAVEWAHALAGATLTGTATVLRTGVEPEHRPPSRSRRMWQLVSAALALALIAGVVALTVDFGGDSDAGDQLATGGGTDQPEDAAADDPAPADGDGTAQSGTDETSVPVTTPSPEPSSAATAEPTATPSPLPTAEISLEDTTGRAVADAVQSLTDLGLLVEVENTPAAGPSGLVLEQEPATGTAQPGDTILLVASAPAPAEDFVGISASDARQALRALGASVSEELAYDPDAVTGIVVSQSVPAGEPVPAMVTLTVGQGPSGIYLEEFEVVDSERDDSEWSWGTGDINGETYTHALSTRVWSGSTESDLRLEWNLSRAFDRLRGTVGYGDTSSANHRVRVQIFGDDVKIYEQDFSLGDQAEVNLDVSGVLRLRLETVRLSPRSGRAYVEVLLGELELLGDPAIVDDYPTAE